MSIDIQCPQCQGSGTTTLPRHLEETLAQIPKSGEISNEEISIKLGMSNSPTAVNNRLYDLIALKLVTRVRDGKCWRYSRVTVATHAKRRKL